ncbi:type I glyceraldehyde-3-phosphate dehydrogenase [Erythrobacter sp. BLCC-B19]|uniref:type I glyceraldehyde-3-phosphate dehydrogenase n=1 Tax=Erythrobacter sp. BLCC-B19 TaxID=3025315 RepID=UPI002361822E|nr:type I glyceraldehyde-3-phosphate dehydrogenase [Erythrobacter sp. BLCC-B19]WDA41009.1 type I glyceraldehyde-3-phosphate dehydrogenase [Erythrobacter sp. BLCC-B19]
MTTHIAINGFGRIGRLLARLILEQRPEGIALVAINDMMDARSCAALYKHDSVHGPAAGDVEFGDGWIMVGGQRIVVTRIPDPSTMDHQASGVDLVIEASGLFTDRKKAAAHIARGARRVLISAPAKDADLTVVQGVNHALLRPEHGIVSNASCTTNALAPVAAVLDRAIGIERGHMTTVHSYTNDQRLHDQYHPDLRRARGGAMSMIPTSTGATKAVAEVLPQLKGKLSGASIRVPTPNVSLIDFVFHAARATDENEINALLEEAAAGPFAGIIATTREPLVSVDFNHNPASVTVDLAETKVTDQHLVRSLGWYDNEWGFANRLLETALQMAAQL